MANNPFGKIFGEEIVKGQKRRLYRDSSQNSEATPPGRYWLFLVLLVLCLGLLSARLFSLTIIEGSLYRRLSEGNRIRETVIAAARGIIYDRSGNVLVRNIPSFKSKSGREFFENKPASVGGGLTESVARDYVYGDLFAHALGYTGEIGKDELDKLSDTGSYQVGDQIGKMGIEKSYDRILHGRDGKELVEVDAIGKPVRILGRVDPVDGQNIKLGLDLGLQQAASASMQGKIGAVVAENPQTGEVMALYSSPTFDPNAFVRNADLSKIFTDSTQPLFDRAIAGQYPPGSTFKIITALSALETGAITPRTQFEDTGILQVGKFSFANWYFTQYGKKEGMVDVVKAIKRSNDIFFYKTGEATGIERLADWAKKMGLGKPLGIDIPGEMPGLMPDPIWLQKTRGENWYLGNSYHVAIGQGDILTTPLQINAWTNIVANGGNLCTPHLLVADKNSDKYCKDVGIKSEYIDLVREGMKEACATGGTGWPLFDFKVQSEKLKIDGLDFFEAPEATISGKPWVSIPTACKTGTAEYGDPQGRTHALFTVFAPVNHPQISVTVVVEGGGEGSNVAAPIAKSLLENWFER